MTGWKLKSNKRTTLLNPSSLSLSQPDLTANLSRHVIENGFLIYFLVNLCFSSLDFVLNPSLLLKISTFESAPLSNRALVPKKVIDLMAKTSGALSDGKRLDI